MSRHALVFGSHGADGMVGVDHQGVALGVGGDERVVWVAPPDGSGIGACCLEEVSGLVDVIDDDVQGSVGLAALLQDEVCAPSQFENRGTSHIDDEPHADCGVEVDEFVDVRCGERHVANAEAWPWVVVRCGGVEW